MMKLKKKNKSRTIFLFLILSQIAAVQIISAQVNTPKPEVSLSIDDTVIAAEYPLCDENGVCYLPGKKITSSMIEIDRSQGFQDVSSPAASLILKYIIFAVIGGFLLNLMPCVFPLLAIKTVSISLQSNDDKRKILLSSLCYAAGIIISLVIIALFLVIFKAAGNFAGWGFHMQNPKFVIMLAAIIFLFALSMFDIFSITIPMGNNAEKISLVKGYAGHFFTGIFAVFFAAPCTAPLLGSATAFALSASGVIIFIFFIFIGIGFALPFALLGLYPKLIEKLPKPGKWSLILKEIMGFILLGTVIYLILPIFKKYPEAIAKIFYFFFITAFAAWFSSAISKTKNPVPVWRDKKLLRDRALKIAAIIIIICCWVFLINDIKTDNKNEKKYYSAAFEKEYIKQFSLDLLADLNSQNIPLFINIYADWCTTCKINDAMVFSSKEIEDFFTKNGIIMLKGDFTEYDGEIAQWMKAFKKTGVPVYAYYHSAEDYLNPVFFPEILTKHTIIKKIRDIY